MSATDRWRGFVGRARVADRLKSMAGISESAILNSPEEVGRITAEIESLGDGIDMLEAGCGRRSPVQPKTRLRLVGVDEDERALRWRAENIRDLDEYHVASLNDVSLEPQSFDVIYCSYVLEHAHGVAQILDNFARWIRPGGRIVIRVPDGRSVYGFLAKWTPHWSHVLVKRYVFGAKNAGKPGYDPYPVVYEEAISENAMRHWTRERGYSLEVLRNGHYLVKEPWLKPFVVLSSVVSLGFLEWRHANLTFIIRT